MGASKEWFLKMREEDYNALSPQQRALFFYAEARESNEWENHKDDPKYRKLKMNEKNARDATQKYLFEKRHNL